MESLKIEKFRIKEEKINKNCEEIGERGRVYLCIGTDKLVFDCLGPMVGSMLRKGGFPHFVYGTMQEPVTALQVETAISFIRRVHIGAEVVVVDSAIGKKEDIGVIKSFDRGLRPALGIDREMRVVGDKSIIGIVTTKDKVKNLASCDVKLKTVYSMAKAIVDMIFEENSNSQAISR